MIKILSNNLYVKKVINSRADLLTYPYTYYLRVK